jgi:hypothetical protein
VKFLIGLITGFLAGIGWVLIEDYVSGGSQVEPFQYEYETWTGV